MNVEKQGLNLVALVKDQLSGSVIGKLAETLGTSPSSASTAASAAVAS